MFSIRSLSRYSASGLHFAVSSAIAMIIAAFMYWIWFPSPLFHAMGGAALFLLIVGVDVTLGPLITLIVFDTRKKSLPYDMAVIVFLQLLALCYGIYAMSCARPVFTVFTGQGFAVVASADIEPEVLAKATREEFKYLSLTGPRLVATEPPSDAEGESLISLATQFGSGIQHFPKYFVPYDDKREAVLKSSYQLSELKMSPEDKLKLEKYLSRTNLQAQTLRFLPVTAQNDELTALISNQGELLKILDIKPAH